MRFIDIGASRVLLSFLFLDLYLPWWGRIIYYITLPKKPQPQNPVDTILFHLKNKNPAHLTTSPPRALLTILPSHQDKPKFKNAKKPLNGSPDAPQIRVDGPFLAPRKTLARAPRPIREKSLFSVVEWS